jgi:hypothetical protein
MTGNRSELGGSFALGPWHVRRAGYGAMQVAGDGGFRPPRDRYEALRVAVAPGVDHRAVLRRRRREQAHPLGAVPLSGRPGDREQGVAAPPRSGGAPLRFEGLNGLDRRYGVLA